MSALGQKQTCAPQNVMSALPPIATAKADIGKLSCLLYPRKRTCAVQLEMSAMGQKRTFAKGGHDRCGANGTVRTRAHACDRAIADLRR
jgi:hypothetical protein